MNSADIQFTGPTCGHHGPYTFYKAFRYRRHKAVSNLTDHKLDGVCWSTLSLGQFFYIRIIPWSSICVGELQLVWESTGGAPGQMLASLKLYFRPEDTPQGRLSTHGQDELVVIKDKFVMEVTDLVKWVIEIDEIPAGWPLNQHKEKDCSPSETRQVCIISYPQYCRYRAMCKRLSFSQGQGQQGQEQTSTSLELAIVKAVGGVSSALTLLDSGRQLQVMFCRSAVSHPDIESHQFRRDSLAPKLKGRKRRKLRLNEKSDTTVAEHRNDGRLKKTVLPSTVEKSQTAVHNGKDLLKKGKDSFEKQLLKFMKENKTPIKRRPSLGFKEVDLFNFYSLAHKYGGYDKITEDRLWKHIYDQLGGHQGNTSAATCTRRIYEKLLLSFERHMRGQETKSLPAPYLRPAKPIRRRRSLSVSTTPATSSESLGGTSNGLDNSTSNSMEHESSNCSSSTTLANIDDRLSSPSSNSKDSSSKHHRKSSSVGKKIHKRHRVEKEFKVKRHKLDDEDDVENESSWSAVTVSAAVNDNVICKVILKNCRRMSLQTPTKDLITDELSATSLDAVTEDDDVTLKTELLEHSSVDQPVAEISNCETSSNVKSNLPCNILTAAVNDLVKVTQSVPNIESVPALSRDTASLTLPNIGKVEHLSSNAIPALRAAAVDLVKPLLPAIDVNTGTDIKTDIKVKECQQNKSLVGGLLVCSSASLGIPLAPSINLSSVCSSTSIINPLVSRLVVGPSMPTFQARQPIPMSSVSVTSTAIPMVNVEGSNWSYPLLNGGTWLALTNSRPPVVSSSIDMSHSVRLGVLPMFGISTSSSLTPSNLAVKAERPCLTVGYRMPVIGAPFECRPQIATSVICSQPSGSTAGNTGNTPLGLNSPIKQFIDRTRVCAPPVVQPVLCAPSSDDGPTDMSMKTLRRQEQESRLNNVTNNVTKLPMNQSNDAPLDLCTKIPSSSSRTDVGNVLPILPGRPILPMTPTHGPILTVPMCFTTKSSAALSLPLSATVGGASAGPLATRIIVPSPRLSCPNGTSMSPLPAGLPRGSAVNLPIMQLPNGSYSQGQSNFAILHPAFQLSPNTVSPIGGGSVPLSPATPVIATLSPFIGSQFLMTQLAAAAQQSQQPQPLTASLNDNQSSCEIRK